jgi:ABC-type lipoprotein release transport system permease subunit
MLWLLPLPLLLVCAAAIASALPALHAARLDPARTLRED